MSAPIPLPEHPRTLDAFAWIALIAAASHAAFFVAAFDAHLVGLAALGCTLVAAGIYVVRRRTADRRWSATALLVAATISWALLGSMFALLPVLLALILLRLDHGLRAAMVGGTLTVAVSVIVLIAVHDRTAGASLAETLGLVGVLAGVLWVAGIVAESYRSRHAADVASAERDRAHLELVQTYAALAASVEAEKELVLAQERARAAGELHDGLGHRLTAIRLGLDYADRVWVEDPESAHAEVVTARDATAQALQEMRVWVRALSPGPRTGLGDRESFEAVAESFRGTGMTVSVSVGGLDEPLSREASLFAHRLIQEGLTNALRHGSATAVRITVEQGGDDVRISLRDNGSGAGGELTEGFGLRSLRERATDLGGSLRAGPTADGFELEATIQRAPVVLAVTP